MGKRESKVESYLNSEIGKLGGDTEKWIGRNGNPDRICFLPGGIIWFVEVKTLNEDLRPEQIRFADRLIKLGANVTCVKGKQGVDELCKKLRMN